MVNVALPWFKGGEGASPSRAVENGGFAVAGSDYVATDGKSSEGVSKGHFFTQRVGNPVVSWYDGDGVLGKINGIARQRHLTAGVGLNLV